MKNSIGICLGASTVSIAERNDGTLWFSRINHEGRVSEVLQNILRNKKSSIIGITGRKFRNLVSIPTVSEPEAVELAYQHLKTRYPEIDCIVSAGGETFMLYLLDKRGKVLSVQTGNKCASGTGEFFLQQIKRMELNIDEAVDLAGKAEPYVLAGRCSVFCKSDCTHALNKGIDKDRICAGLSRMMAGKLVELLKKSKAENILAVGGVSLNRQVTRYLRKDYPRLSIPEEAPCFEALGALLWAEREGLEPAVGDLFRESASSFPFFPALRDYLPKVSFKTMPQGQFYDGEYILGLDVGSTTTKAVLLRTDNYAVVAHCYLRTNGDPVGASRRCYESILSQLPPELHPDIIGLGVTGSGRQIAGLHALTPGIINEIVAHAAAAVFFDPEVETIFEIGGQDAKYTYVTNMVASDYAMNEACSAGTGSFLEEACRESFTIGTGEIADIALASSTPLNFNDQCAAFIGSDIKTAVQEGSEREDIVAGLVYSVCQNYLNRVKGNRKVGRKVFMQGGVCYNRAVPVAMAALCGNEIIVPPEPGLMGAFGVALEIDRKIRHHFLDKQHFDLADLASREVHYGEPFVCGGGTERCDRKCSINRITVSGKTYPFGGACNMYYNLRRHADSTNALDLVGYREEQVFSPPPLRMHPKACPTVGIVPSLLTCTLYPLYTHFFANLGVRIITSTFPDPGGMESTGSSFCYPVELSHGFMKDLLNGAADYIFVPHVAKLAPENSEGVDCTCPFVQGEPYYLKAAFHEELEGRFVTEVLDIKDEQKLRRSFISIGRQIGYGPRQSAGAFAKAWKAFTATRERLTATGRKFLQDLQPGETALVLFGRPYNAFSRFANMGIPHKFSSRGYKVIPHDLLPLGELGCPEIDRMYWATGQVILQAANFVRNHPNLFGVYVTNFSCGPDSFLVGYFRDLMGQKPSLTLELDAHTADAGVDTRIEAFLDVVSGYQELNMAEAEADDFVPSGIVHEEGRHVVRAGNGRSYLITDPEVHVLIPSMGDTSTQFIAAAMRFAGINATALDPPGQTELLLGKSEATCKECLPLLLTTGSLLRYLKENEDKKEIIAYFMMESDGPCRLGQYSVFLKNVISKRRWDNVSLLSLTCENGYAGMPRDFTRRAWIAVNIGDGLDEIYSAILALAEDHSGALGAFEKSRERLARSIANDDVGRLMTVLKEEMRSLSLFRRKFPLEEATRVSLVGEIFVRRDGFSRQYLVERLARKGIVVKTAPVAEWLYYIDHSLLNGFAEPNSLKKRVAIRMKNIFMQKDEKMIKGIMSRSGFYEPHLLDIDYLVRRGSRLVNPNLVTEAILTVSSTLSEIGDETHGVISIGPFGCMPCRIAQSILHYRIAEEKENFSRSDGDFWAANKGELALPFLAVETDGNAFPQLVEAQLESFVLSANRLKAELLAARRQSIEGR